MVTRRQDGPHAAQSRLLALNLAIEEARGGPGRPEPLVDLSSKQESPPVADGPDAHDDELARIACELCESIPALSF